MDAEKLEDVQNAERLIRLFVRRYRIPADRALTHLQGWRPDLACAYRERLEADAAFRARFDRRIKRDWAAPSPSRDICRTKTP